MTEINPLYDPKTDNQAISTDVQSMLNQPLAAGSWTDEEQIFLNELIAKVEAGTIQLYSPSTLINTAVYEQLSPEAQGKADFNAMNMLSKIREIVNLMKLYSEANYEVKNLVESLFENKKNLESAGDIFII